MHYIEFPPPADLQQYIRCFGVMEENGLGDTQRSYRVMADGTPGLIFQQDPDVFLGQDGKKLPQLFLHGLTTKYFQKMANGNYRNMVVHFHPCAIHAIFGIGASELTDRHADLNEILKSDVSERLLYETTDHGRIEVLSAFVRGLIGSKKKEEMAKTRFAVASMNARIGNGVLADIRYALNLSERTLERLFQSSIGVSPKLFLRLNRFQKALQQIREGSFKSLTEVAYAQCYSDQSHCIREFREFAGVNPSHFLFLTNDPGTNFTEWKM